MRSSSVADPVAGAGTSTQVASSAPGTSPAPRVVHTTRTRQPMLRSQRTSGVAAASTP